MNPLTEEHLRTALHARADEVQPDEDAALTSIRRRGHTAIVRRRAVLGGAVAALVLAFAVVVLPQLGDDNSQIVVDPGPEETTAPQPAPTTTTPPTTTAVEPVDPAYLWPPVGHQQYSTPEEAARSFVTEYVGVPEPPLGDVVEEEPRRVQVPVYAKAEDGSTREDITRSTIHLVQVNDGTWRVVLAESEALVVDSLEPTQSAIVVRGRGRGFEGTVIVEARAEGSRPGEYLDQEILIAGSAEELAPFEASLALPRPPLANDSVFVYNDSGFESAVPDFTAMSVHFATGTTVGVYFVGSDGTVQATTRPVQRPAVLNGALAALFQGPTAEEQAQGVSTALPANAASFSPTATITEGIAHVDIPIGIAQPDPSQSGQTLPPDQAQLMVEQLWRTVFQFPNISQVEFTLSGSCQDFGLWTGQRGICLFDRALLEED